MDQVKVGRFIAECRKNKNMTQAELAEKLNITDRAISKWETGKGMPDSSIMLELCGKLDISVNELLSGEVIKMETYNVRAEQNLLEMKKQKEEADKRLLKMEIIRVLLIAFGFITFIIGGHYALVIEQIAGYYECAKCHNKYVPTYKSVFLAMHSGRTRYMKCPKCNKKSWNKKVLAK